ncbi:MAG: MATE family efflux transporter [Erysipelotrichales bacterium]|nr:MATE family efflux transporter [Erysipelotrichales bacterium]
MTETNAYYEKMTKTPLTRLIVSLGIPTTISMLVTNIYNMVDTYFVGTLGPSQQAATGILFTLQCIIQAVAFMLGQGSGTLVSKALADKDVDEASTYVSSAFIVGISLGIILLTLGVIFLEPLMMMLGSTETILPYAKQYGICVVLTCPIMIGSFVLNNNLRYEGQSFYAMIGLTIGGIINIFGDYLLISIISLGVLGAGIATAVSQCISFTILLWFHFKMAQGNISFKYFSKDLKIYQAICTVGFPSLIRQGLNSLSNGLLNNITRPFGDAAIAAMSVVNRFSAFVMCVGLGVGQGFQPVASFNYQAKEYDRVKKGLLVTMGISIVFICILAVPGMMFPETVVRLFQKDQEVIAIGRFALRAACFGVIFMTLSVPVNMLYQSTRQPKIASFLSILRNGLLFIPMLIISTNLFGLVGIQISQPFADIVAGLISIPFIISFLKKEKFD